MKNWKGVLTILLMSVLSLGFSLSAFAAETDALQLKSKSAVLMQARERFCMKKTVTRQCRLPA